MAQRGIEFVLKFLTDKQAARESIREAEKLNAKLDEIRSTAEQVNARIGELEDISARSLAAATAVFAPLVLAAQNYVNQVGEATQVSRDWIALSERQQQAQLQLGAKAAEALLPYKELLIEVIELASEIDPNILQAGVAGAAVLGSAASLGLLVSAITRLYTGILLLSANIRTLAASSGVQRAGVAGVAIAAGTGAGLAITRAGGRLAGDERLANQGVGDIVDTLVDIVKVIVASFLFIQRLVRQGVVTLEFFFDRLVIDAREILARAIEKLGAIPDFVEQQIIALQLFAFEIGGAGINLGELLGLDRGALERRRDELRRPEEDTRISDLINDILFTGFTDLDVITSIVDEVRAVTEAGGNATKVLADRLRETGQVTEDELNTILNNFDRFANARRLAEEELGNSLDFIEQQTQDWTESIFNLNQEMDKVTDKTTSVEDVMQYGEELLDSFADYQQSRRQQQQAFEQEELERERSFNEKITNIEEDYQAQRLEAARELQDELTTLDSDYYESQRQAREDFQRSEAEIAEDYRREQLRREEDYRQQLADAAGRRDARAVLNILRNRQRDRDRSREDFQVDRERRQEQFQEQQEDAQEAYQERRRDLINAFNQEREERRRAYNERLSETRRLYNQETVDRRIAFAQELQDQQSQFRRMINQQLNFQNEEYGARALHYARLTEQLNAFIAATSGGSLGLGNLAASGGSFYSGIRQMQQNVRNNSISNNSFTFNGGAASAANIEQSVEKALGNILQRLS